MRELLSISESARFLGVQEARVRVLVREGRLKPVTEVDLAEPQFARSEIERYADQRRGRSVERSAPRVRTVEPQFVSANDITRWTGRIAQETAPELIRRLLRATRGVSGISVRAGDGVALGGWDGVAKSDGSAGTFLPVGQLGIEIGTTGDIAGKAEKDFRNRLAIPKSEREKIHFVFVTTRRWRDKATWAADKAALGEFASVSVLDADDLEGWLQAERNVHIWFSELLGMQPRDVQSLERWWREFSRTTDPALPEELFDVRPSLPIELVEGFLSGASEDKVLILRGTWREQVLATMSRVFTKSDENVTPVVVRSSSAWSRLLENGSPLVLIPLFDEPDVGGALAAGHRVALIAGADTQLRQGTRGIDVEPLGRFEASRVLEASGHSTIRAERLAALFRRSPKAFVRSVSLDPRVRSALPGATAEESSIAARLALAVQWSASTADRRVLERLTGSSWEELERILLTQESSDDPMFVRAGESWRVAAPVESSAVQYPRITTHDLEIWVAELRNVLLAPHPFDELDQTQRLVAELRGEERPRSRTLTDGFTHGLALMALVEEEVAGRRGEDVAAGVVRSVLLDEGNVIDSAVWRRVDYALPLLAEASPNVFLDAVLDDLSSEKPSLLELFAGAEERETDVFSATSPHVYVLWALEVLADSVEFFDGATRALAALCEATPPDSKSGSSAFDSLVNYLYPWLRYSDAGAEAQHAVIDRMTRGQPDLAWRVLARIVNIGDFYSTQPARPRFREWGSGDPLIRDEAWVPAFDVLIKRTVELAGSDLERWTDLIPTLGRLSSQNFDLVLSGLEDAVIAAGTASAAARVLWRKLDAEISRHREHSQQHWSLTKTQVERLGRVLSALPSPGVASESSNLFGWWPHIEGIDRTSEAFHPEWRRLQLEAMAAVLASGGSELEELVAQAENPYGVGTVLAEWPSEAHDAMMLGWLESTTDSHAQASRGYLSWRANTEGGREWLTSTLRTIDSEHDQSALLLLVEPAVAIDLLEDLEPDLADAYWQNVNPWRVEPPQARLVFERLLSAGRYVAALRLLGIADMREAQGGPVGFELADAETALRGILRGDSEEVLSNDAWHVVVSALDFLQKRGAEVDLLAPLEFAFFAAIEHSSHHPAALYRALRERPSEFVNLVKMSTRSTHDDDESSVDTSVVTTARRVLSEWNELPGTDGSNWDAQPDQLRQWVNTVRDMLTASGRAKIGDEKVGAVLATGAGSAQEGWPCLSVRELLEDLGSRDVEQGFYSSAHMARGIYTKSVYEGGAQERELAQRFRDRAEECREWRRTSRLLRAIADAYEREARSQDASAKWDEDEL